MGGRGGSGSRNSGKAPEPQLTRTERLVNLIADDIIGDWIDGNIDEDEFEGIENWHELLEHLGMEAAEAREDIIEDLWQRAGTFEWWRKNDLPEEDKKLIFMDGEFENENGDYMKYGEVMKLVKQRLKDKGIMQTAR